MTSKTKRTLATIDALAGVPHLLASNAKVVVPRNAWRFYELRQDDDIPEWWQTRRTKYDAGLLFRLKD